MSIGGERPEGDAVQGIEAVVRGRVQGVGYRDFTRREAEKLGVAGWVRNEPDGSVRAVLLHPRGEILEQLIARLRSGPQASHVTGVETQAIEGAKFQRGFEIRR